MAVERGTKAVISVNFSAYGKRRFNNLRANFVREIPREGVFQHLRLFPTNAFCGRDRVRCRSSRAARISSKIVPSFSGSVSMEAAAVSSSQVFSSRFGLSLSIATSFRRAAAFCSCSSSAACKHRKCFQRGKSRGRISVWRGMKLRMIGKTCLHKITSPMSRAASEDSPAPSTLIPLAYPASTPQIRVP